jgi:prepilin-type N-terminal cleavage/methylation domain-containing protein
MRRAAPASTAPLPRHPRRAGFTLVEMTIAMMIMVIGVLSLVGTSSSVARMIGGARRSTLAATLAQSRLERLRSLDCSAAAFSGGTAVTHNITERWTVTTVVGTGAGATVSARLLVDSLFFANERGIPQRQVYSSVRVCP